ncbi:MAG: hypothetical protein AAB645_00545 [Patescibacteria group bacterium]
MKTIFITIFHGHIARNILLTDILKYLKEDKDLRVIMLCPDFKRDYYQQQFGGGNVSFEGVPALKPGRLDHFFRTLYYYFVDSDTVRLLEGEKYILAHRYVRYFFSRLVTKILGNIRPLRRLIRALDRQLVKPQGFGQLFDKYQPDLLFVASITSDQDTMVLREAGRRSVHSLGMVRSWDNFLSNKGNVRIYPDKLLVHNRFLADDAVQLADFSPDKVITIGMPHFDFYVNEPRLSREETCRRVGADPKKPFLLFLMIGPSSAKLDIYVTALLEKLIATEPKLKDFQLIVRPHPNTGKQVEGVGPKTLVNYPKLLEFGSSRLTDREFTKEDIDMFAGLISHAAVVISYQGTSNVDTAALGRPIVNIKFDESENVPYLKSVRSQYEWSHVPPIVATGGIRIVESPEELREAILEYDEHPERDAEKRKQIVSDQCYNLDGQASRRAVDEIKKSLGK